MPAVTEKPQRQRMMERCFIMMNRFGLSRAERLEFATILLDRNVDTFNALSVQELFRIIDAVHGAEVMYMIQIERKKGLRTRNQPGS